MIKQVIARHAPMSDKVVVFMVDSKRDDSIEVFTEGQVKTVGMDYYRATYPISTTDAKKVAEEFARFSNIPADEVLIRARLPKVKTAVKHARRTNDANLTLVQKGDQQADELAVAAQALHDGETQKAPKEKAEDAQPKQKRSYRKQTDKQLSARSAAALRRYHQELESSSKETPAAPEVQAAPTMNEDSLKEQKLLTAMKLIKEIGSEVKPGLVKSIMDLL